MIIVKMRGGLGNQMFQYAAARGLALKRRTELKLDIETELSRDAVRHYALEPFCISARFATVSEIDALSRPRPTPWQRIRRRLTGRAAPPPASYFPEKALVRFDPEMLECPENTYLDGYWQNPRYFQHAQSEIRRELQWRKEPVGANRATAAQIASCESASVHVRRGDYVCDRHANETHGTCSVEYYRECARRLVAVHGPISFFVFSDEPDWARQALQLPGPTMIVDNNSADTPHEDLRLMSMCRHHIIANSSFSWWGAWLGMHPTKHVFAPKAWFRDQSRQTYDLIPPEWERVL